MMNRRGIPVPAAERPIKYRDAARVLVRVLGPDGRQRILLIADRDPGVPGSAWWLTPGGGIDPGETERDAAVRELQEETGLQFAPQQLRGPVAKALVRHGFCDRILVQQETFFVLDLPAAFEPSSQGWTQSEQQTFTGYRWMAVDEMAGQEIWPAWLPKVVNWDGEDCVEYPPLEQSSVAILPGQAEDHLPR